MTVIPMIPEQELELLRKMHNRFFFFQHKSQLIPFDELPVENLIQRDPPRKQHHDHLIPRHIRSPQHRSRHHER